MQSFTPLFTGLSRPINWPLLRQLGLPSRFGHFALACIITAVFSTPFLTPIAHAATDDDTIISVEPVELLSDEQLRELVAPIALYSDELLAIVLPASTYPLQIVAAARYREAVLDDPSLEPDEYWDESIVALLNYPEALAFLNADLDWTWELGQAVTDQQAKLLAAVSNYRDEAYAAGNLESDDKHVVAVEEDVVTITSADPEVIHVPYYDPEEVTIYQTERVYHYYPTAYPVYYYPYSSWHRFYDDRFWGINSAFVLSWGGFYLGHHLHNHHYHPYFGRRYHRNHYRFTYHYNSSHAYKKRHKYRHKYRDQRPKHRRDYDRWQPDRRWMGDRPNRAERRIARTHPRERHLSREHRQLYKDKERKRERRFDTERQRSAAHRSPRREQNSLAQNGNRSSVHRPRPNTRDARIQPRQPQARQAQTRQAPRKRDEAVRQYRNKQNNEQHAKLRTRDNRSSVNTRQQRQAKVSQQRPQRQVQRQVRTQPQARQINRSQRQAKVNQQRAAKQFKQARERKFARPQPRQQRPERAKLRTEKRSQTPRNARIARQQ